MYQSSMAICLLLLFFFYRIFTIQIFVLWEICSRKCLRGHVLNSSCLSVLFLLAYLEPALFVQRLSSFSTREQDLMALYFYVALYPPFKVFKYRNFYKCSSLACSRRWDSGVRCEGSFSAHMYLFALFPRSERLDLKYHSNGREWITEKIQALSFFLSFREKEAEKKRMLATNVTSRSVSSKWRPNSPDFTKTVHIR